LQTQEGWLGAIVLANAETGEGASVTYWQTADAMAASEQTAAAGRAEAQASGLEIQDIDRFEMLLQDRAAPSKVGTFARINDVRASAAQIDTTVAFVRDTAPPALRALSGYRALAIFANRDSGRVLVSSVWDTAADREASESVIGGLRRQMLEIAQPQTEVRIARFEVVLAETSQAAQQAATSAAGPA